MVGPVAIAGNDLHNSTDKTEEQVDALKLEMGQREKEREGDIEIEMFAEGKE